jgi:hypothetical protein
MTKEYTVVTTPSGEEVIQYEENGVLYTIPKDEANSDYQRYLNPEAEQSTPMIPGDE